MHRYLMEKSKPKQTNMKKSKVLVVEDESIIAIDIQNQLQSLGYEVGDIVSSGVEAVDKAGDLLPDVILMDIMLKGEMDGIQAAQRIREQYNIPVIFVTAYSDQKTLTRAKITEPFGYLLKPFEERSLHTTIEIALYKHKAEQKINTLAYYDTLTGLPNRTSFFEDLEKHTKEATKDGLKSAVLFIDMDRFKNVNDSLGHNIGDMLLKEVGKRLKEIVNDNISVYRLGGDEFTVIVHEIETRSDAAAVAKDLLERLSRTYYINDYVLDITPSIGIAVYPTHSDSPDFLITFADAAMYRAKKKGGNTYKFYTSRLHDQYNERLMVETHLRKALENNEFQVFYQPKIDLSTREIVGMEALLRWENPVLGLVYPEDFIPIAEESGIILEIGKWVLDTVCKQTKYLQDKKYPKTRVSVNISFCEFNKDLVTSIKDILDANEYDPSYLELEITENIAMRKLYLSLKTLKELHDMGVSIALDDFGTGYSSLSYLQLLPISTLKIDKRFIQDITVNPRDKGIVQAIILMGHSLGLTVIAEGVETDEQIELLRQLECDQIQGYFLSYPLPSEIINKFM